MGQRRWARLAIGGALSRDALAGALEEGQVVVEDAEASRGGFSELEAWLETRGIPFDLESGGLPRRVARQARPLPPRAGGRVHLRRQPCGTGDPPVVPTRGADPLPDPQGSARVAHADGPGDPRARTDHLDAGRAMPPLSDTEALNRIHECLNGLEWSADILEAIAALVEATGRPIAPPPVSDRR